MQLEGLAGKLFDSLTTAAAQRRRGRQRGSEAVLARRLPFSGAQANKGPRTGEVDRWETIAANCRLGSSGTMRLERPARSVAGSPGNTKPVTFLPHLPVSSAARFSALASRSEAFELLHPFIFGVDQESFSGS